VATEPSIEIEVQISPEFADQVAESLLRAAARATLHYEVAAGQVTVVLTNDEEIKALNAAYLGRDRPTDVLAFGAQEQAGTFVAAPEAGAYLGDVIISYPRAVEQAAEQGHPVGQELRLLVVHGVLHLLGYDHAEAEEQAEMWARQARILEALANGG
jgi:probable rRNA maturation factor